MKTILITGATGSIGLTLCNQLARKGHALIITARNKEKLQILAEKIYTEFKTKVTCAASDFSDPVTFTDLLKLTGTGIDGLVIMPPQPLPTKQCLPADSVWENMFKTSFIGAVALIRDLIPALTKNRAATVLISGMTSKQPHSEYALSNVLRTAWTGQIKTMADVYGTAGLRFNTLSLGGIITDKLIAKITQENKATGKTITEALTERTLNIPLRKYATLTEVADMVDLLINSEASQHLTGQNIVLDGGFTRPY